MKIGIDITQPKQQEEKIKPPKGFTLDYLDYDQREKILKHLKAGKTFKCHHKNCESFEIDSTTLYEYNVHCLLVIKDIHYIQNYH